MITGDRQKYLNRRDTLVEQVIRKKTTIANGAEGLVSITIPNDANVFLKGVGWDYFGSATYKLLDDHRQLHAGSNQIGSCAIPQQWSIPFYCKGKIMLYITNSTGASQDYTAVFIIHTDKLLEDASEGGAVLVPVAPGAGVVQDVQLYGFYGTTSTSLKCDTNGYLMVQLTTTPTIDIGDVAIMGVVTSTDTKINATTIGAGNTALHVNISGEGGAALAAANPLWCELTDGTNAIAAGNPLPVTAVSTSSPSTLLDGSSVTTSDTAVALGASTACRRITVQAANANTTVMYVGNATSQTTELYPGDSIDLEIDNISKVYIKRVPSGANVTANYIGG